ncbi:MAG: sugar ABC transporter permease [Eubacterium sp.]|nr:sugar ABC transporter permease [Eubacterium sp.]
MPESLILRHFFSIYLRERRRNVKKQNIFQKFLYSQKVAPYVFVLPFLLSFCIFWIYPLCSTVVMSFQDIKPVGAEWVGVTNYTKLLKDSVFHTAIGNSFLYMILTLILLIPFPMLFAALMDSRLVKAKGLWKAILYMPSLTSVVISGTLFRFMFTEMKSGQMNKIMVALGMQPIEWLKIKGTAYVALLMLACWRWTGVNMLYFLSGLKGIDTSLYESAEIDGATSWKRFWYITLPLLKPTTIYVCTISIYAGLAMFLESFMLWPGNTSPKNIGLTIVGYLYRRGIEKNQMGYASAVGLVLLVIALIINMVQLVMTGTFKKEER